MAGSTSLEDIVRAIAGSIMHAQHLVEKAQIANFSSFFTDDKEPTSIDIKLPATHSAAQPDDMMHYRLPLLSLVPHSSLVIGEAEIDLDLELGSFEEVERTANAAMLAESGNAAPAETKATLMVSPANASKNRSGSVAHIKLKLQASEKTEGLARLLDDVIKCQGPLDFATGGAAPASVEAPAAPAGDREAR
ncbi:DUF2589 domain-containing protein [Paraburkholderia sp. Ac-20347]|jgi:hypothetical protein|uniref:DUF2589 domain-containing protein n=1 Tax=Paraburkholderia sp. Ac-20347 TaxID=2703892 RepID=UPI00197E3A8F|nr:DUF2589 domain-containing protein [Paraburkholderia sp. Ac-20347]MBN3810151.1 DUF2589 domain-containing protein [Paraburkholderia sp. Ac-20347]